MALELVMTKLFPPIIELTLTDPGFTTGGTVVRNIASVGSTSAVLTVAVPLESVAIPCNGAGVPILKRLPRLYDVPFASLMGVETFAASMLLFVRLAPSVENNAMPFATVFGLLLRKLPIWQ